MRKLHLDNGNIVEYNVGKSYVLFRFTEYNSLVVHIADVKGLTPDVFERGRRKNNSDGRVTPGELKMYLKEICGASNKRT